jgi:uncharacterized membrane protein
LPGGEDALGVMSLGVWFGGSIMVLLGVVSFMLVFSMMGCLVLDIAVVIVEPSKGVCGKRKLV